MGIKTHVLLGQYHQGVVIVSDWQDISCRIVAHSLDLESGNIFYTHSFGIKAWSDLEHYSNLYAIGYDGS